VEDPVVENEGAPYNYDITKNFCEGSVNSIGGSTHLQETL
jgi:hypothetical protein